MRDKFRETADDRDTLSHGGAALHGMMFVIGKRRLDCCCCSDVHQSSGKHAPKCSPFSILCTKSVIIRPSIACMPIRTGVGVK